MEKSQENPRTFQSRSCFFEECGRANLLLFSKLGAT